MEEREKKDKPSVMITTYSSSNLNKTKQQQQQQDKGIVDEKLAQTKCETSTDLFSPKRSPMFKSKLILHDLNQIKGPSGSIRGHKDVVKKSLENLKSAASNCKRNFASPKLPSFMAINANNLRTTNVTLQQIDELSKSEYLDKLIEEEQNQCVAYTTTLGVIRRTFEDSKQMRSILNLNLIKYEERDIYLNQEYREQLKLRCKSIKVPALFVDGHLLGGIKELELINENGKLPLVLAKFKMLKAQNDVCICCGNARFIACQSCNGSRKSTIHHFKFNSIALRCIKCDKNDGLVQCPLCCSNSNSSSSNINTTMNNNNDNTSRIGHQQKPQPEVVVRYDDNNNNMINEVERI